MSLEGVVEGLWIAAQSHEAVSVHIHPRRLVGPWVNGYSLDVHTTSVFIGGSRAVSRLPRTVRDKLDDLIKRHCAILIGDANGADRAVQQYFAERAYPHVVVYCMDHCRNNLGGWPTRHVTWPGNRKGFAYYAAKDAAMAQDAKCGVMLWDGKSKGTLNNVQQLVREGKKTLVYLAPERTFHRLASADELDELLHRCDQDHVEAARQQINAKLANQLPLNAPHP